MVKSIFDIKLEERMKKVSDKNHILYGYKTAAEFKEKDPAGYDKVMREHYEDQEIESDTLPSSLY